MITLYEKKELIALCLFDLCLCIVCFVLFALLLGVIGGECSVIVAPPGDFPGEVS